MTVGALFGAGNSSIRSTTGTDFSMAGMTVGALFYSTASVANDGVIVATVSSGSPALIFAASWDTTSYYISHNGATTSGPVSGLDPTTGVWHMVLVSKASGTATPRFHEYNGTSWQHSDGNATLGDPSSTIDSVEIGDIPSLAANISNLMNLAWVGIWNETTDDSTAETYTNYTTLAAKSNAVFFTGTSLASSGTMNDIGSGNNDETGRTAISIGNRGIPSWFTNFAGMEAWKGEVGDPVANTTGAASTSFTVSTLGATVATAGSLLVATVAVDNSQTSPAGDPPGLTITDSRSNSWTVESAALNDPGAANAGTAGYIAWTNASTSLQASDTITFTWGTGNPPAKAITVDAFSPLYRVTDSTTASGTSTTPSASRTPTAIGQLVVGAIAIEGGLADTHAADTDTTDGTWYHLSRHGAGTTTSGQTILSAYKVVTGTSAQTYNSTITSRDWCEKIVVFTKASPWKWVPRRLPGWVARGRGRQARSR